MALLLLRCLFVLVAAGVAVTIINMNLLPREPTWLPWVVFLTILAAAAGVITIDMRMRKKRVDTISAIYFGLIVGLFLTYIAGVAVNPVVESPQIQHVVQLVLGLVLCYTCISVLLQTKDDFRFIIPYVEFAKQVKGLKPFVLDTSVIIDGRVADVVETSIIDSPLVMPRFVLSELQGIADSSDRLRRSRGRRGLDILNRLRNNKDIDLRIYDQQSPDMETQSVDMRLVLLTKQLDGKLVTGDYNLSKVAQLHNVQVVNLNDLANALKPIHLPGETLDVRLVKQGEGDGQGVGYLDDGTMVVVEGGRPHLQQMVRIAVTSVLQTSAGRMIFGRYECMAPAGPPRE